MAWSAGLERALAWLVGVGLAAAALGPSAAAACSCPPGKARLSRQVVPEDGDVGFPTDGLIRVYFSTRDWGDAAGAAVGDYRLRGPGGALVPLTSAFDGLRLDLAHPPLEPDAAYTLEQVAYYTDAGRRATDTEAFGDGIDPTTRLTPLWFPIARFRTGAGPSGDRPPEAPVVEEATVSHRVTGANCGPGSRIEVTACQARPGGGFDLIEVEQVGRGILTSGPAREGELGASVTLEASSLLCDRDPIYVAPDPTTRVRVRAISPSGVTGPWSDPALATAASGYPFEARRTPPSEVKLPDSLPFETPPGLSGPAWRMHEAPDGPPPWPGPAPCPWGPTLGLAWEALTAADTASQRAALEVVGGDEHALFVHTVEGDASTYWSVPLAGGPAEALPLSGYRARKVVRAPGGYLLVEVELEVNANVHREQVVFVNERGVTRWSRLNLPDTTLWETLPPLVSGDTVAIITRFGNTFTGVLAYTVQAVRLADGKPIEGEPVAIEASRYLQAFADEEGFVFVTTPTDKAFDREQAVVNVTRVGRDGRVVARSAPDLALSGIFDLVPTPEGGFAMAAFRYQVDLAEVSANGQVVAKPLNVSQGVPTAAPRLAPFGDGYLVYFGRHELFLSLVRPGGPASAPVSVGQLPGMDTYSAPSSFGLAVGQGQVLAWRIAYQDGGRSLSLAPAQCALEPEFGPPQVLSR